MHMCTHHGHGGAILGPIFGAMWNFLQGNEPSKTSAPKRHLEAVLWALSLYLSLYFSLYPYFMIGELLATPL